MRTATDKDVVKLWLNKSEDKHGVERRTRESIETERQSCFMSQVYNKPLSPTFLSQHSTAPPRLAFTERVTIQRSLKKKKKNHSFRYYNPSTDQAFEDRSTIVLKYFRINHCLSTLPKFRWFILDTHTKKKKKNALPTGEGHCDDTAFLFHFFSGLWRTLLWWKSTNENPFKLFQLRWYCPQKGSSMSFHSTSDIAWKTSFGPSLLLFTVIASFYPTCFWFYWGNTVWG